VMGLAVVIFAVCVLFGIAAWIDEHLLNRK
jgi:hypothetical protein